MPPIFFPVMGSRSMSHASSITHIGIVVVTIDASPGEVSPTPKIKHPWLKSTPRKAAPARRSRSGPLTCSFGKKSPVSQKRTAAPKMRKSTIRSDVSAEVVSRSLVAGAIRPHITLAPSMAACPFILKSLIIQRFVVGGVSKFNNLTRPLVFADAKLAILFLTDF